MMISTQGMASLQAHGLSLSAPAPSLSSRRRVRCRASLHVPADVRAMVALGELKVDRRSLLHPSVRPGAPVGEDMVVKKLYAIVEAAADRAEMHDIIGRQRDNWNHLFLHSVNSLALAASLMAGFAPSSPNLVALKLSSGLLLAASAVTMAAVNKIQPSQLAEEQRNATRLWRQLEREIHTMLKLGTPQEADVREAMDKVLALDGAYPLPLLPGMLDKFPKAVEPTRWWPRKQQQQHKKPQSAHKSHQGRSAVANGWSRELEEEMRGILRVLKLKDEEQYVSLGRLVLNLNRGLAVAGPAVAGLSAVAAGFIGCAGTGPWAAGAAVVGGALAAAVNTVEHGGQVGMVFEIFRNCAGYYRKMEEEIEWSLAEGEAERRENGEMVELKVALQLGRSPSDLRDFASLASPSFVKDDDIKDFAGKLL